MEVEALESLKQAVENEKQRKAECAERKQSDSISKMRKVERRIVNTCVARNSA